MIRLSSVRAVIAASIISFIAGIACSSLFMGAKSSHVPEGDFAEIVMLRGISYQASMSVKKDSDSGITLWMREDRYAPFTGDTGIVGETMYTNISINCKDLTIAINEQRAFTAAMEFIGERQGAKTFAPPVSLLGLTAVVAFCAPTHPPTSGPTSRTSSTVEI